MKGELKEAILNILERKDELDVIDIINLLGLKDTRGVRDKIRAIFKELAQRDDIILIQKRGKFVIKKLHYIGYEDLKFVEDINKINTIYKKILEFGDRRYRFLLCRDEGLFLVIVIEKLKEFFDKENLIYMYIIEKAYKKVVEKQEVYLIFANVLRCSSEYELVNLIRSLDLERLYEKKREDIINEELEKLKQILEVE